MKPIDFRNETFAGLRARMNESREHVYRAWVQHGPGTTAEVSQRSGIPILTFRPRTTDLYEIGLVALVDAKSNAHGGTYRARTVAEASAWFESQRQSQLDHQPLLI